MKSLINRKLLCVCSQGGHYVQMTLLEGFCNRFSATYAVAVSEDSCRYDVDYVLKDSNLRSGFLAILFTVIDVCKILLKCKPDVVLSTGALPGFLACFFGKFFFGAKVVWVDSVANAEKLSISGRFVKYFADITCSQWESVAHGDERVTYIGRLL